MFLKYFQGDRARNLNTELVLFTKHKWREGSTRQIMFSISIYQIIGVSGKAASDVIWH